MSGRNRGFRRKKRNKGSILFVLTAMMLVAAIAMLLADTQLSTQLNAIAASQAKNISSIVINDAVMEVITENGIKYDDLVSIEYDSDNRVSALKTDSIKMNSLKSLISSKISVRIGEADRHQISIAIGSLSGVDMLYNKGPRINVEMTLAGNATTSIENVFESAGINQTRHQINLSISTTVFVVLANSSTSAEVITSMTIAETVIVGLVPEFYGSPDNMLDAKDAG